MRSNVFDDFLSLVSRQRFSKSAFDPTVPQAFEAMWFKLTGEKNFQFSQYTRTRGRGAFWLWVPPCISITMLVKGSRD